MEYKTYVYLNSVAMFILYYSATEELIVIPEVYSSF